MRFNKIYLEITNRCNLSCSFCPGTKRPPADMSLPDFRELLPKLRPYTDYLYFHLMGEPLSHPLLKEFLHFAGEMGFRVILTTNGTLFREKLPILLGAGALHKVNISLHSFEANSLGALSLGDYLASCFSLPSERPFIVSYRLWNGGGANLQNAKIEAALHAAFPGEWRRERSGYRLAENCYLNYGDKFDWPEAAAGDNGPDGFCYGLRDQLGVLVDGTVVPCCLDHEGSLALGNLHSKTMEDILASPRAKAIYDGFSGRKRAEDLCRRCGYALRFDSDSRER